jgi:hypothetical protein
MLQIVEPSLPPLLVDDPLLSIRFTEHQPSVLVNDQVLVRHRRQQFFDLLTHLFHSGSLLCQLVQPVLDSLTAGIKWRVRIHPTKGNIRRGFADFEGDSRWETFKLNLSHSIEPRDGCWHLELPLNSLVEICSNSPPIPGFA